MSHAAGTADHVLHTAPVRQQLVPLRSSYECTPADVSAQFCLFSMPCPAGEVLAQVSHCWLAVHT